MLDSAAGGRVRESIERDSEELAELALSLSALPDLSGDEVAVAEAVAAWFRAAGIDATLQPLTPTSANVIALVGPDDGSVPTLMLSSHLDTEGSLPEGDGAERRRLRGAWREGDLLVGKGLVNDKTQLAAMLVAMRAIHRLGWPLAGGLLFLGTAQECGAPVRMPERLARGEGPHMGEGSGARWAMANGIRASLVLVGEPTGFAISAAQAGYVRVRVTVPGFIPYTPFLERGDDPVATPNPLERAAHVVIRLVAWAKEYERRERLPFDGGTVAPKAQVQDIRRVAPLFTQADDPCDVYVDVRTAPGSADDGVLSGIAAALADLPFACELSVYDRETGHIARGADALIEAVELAHGQVFGSPPGAPRDAQVSMWHDTNAFNDAGIPAVSYGIAPRPEAFTRERIRSATVDDLVRLAQVYALAAIQLCGVEGEGG